MGDSDFYLILLYYLQVTLIVFSVIPAFLVFYGIYAADRFVSQSSQENQETPVPEKTTVSPAEKRKNLAYIAGIMVVLVPFVVSELIGNTESCGRFEVYTIDQSQTPNDGVIHLTEQDFREFPKMAHIIKDAQMKCETSGTCDNEMGKSIGGDWFACRDERLFQKYNKNLLEHKGKFYFMNQTWVV